ncbi:hypothetical protein Leryth_003122 [Lithospermum erythrorhizon]|nr:hypothetical protein Leryth_003122 [Lithospermum erythrorhizon]
MHAGLASENGSKLKMLISYVDNLPTGSVNGCNQMVLYVDWSSPQRYSYIERPRICRASTLDPWLAPHSLSKYPYSFSDY